MQLKKRWEILYNKENVRYDVLHGNAKQHSNGWEFL